MAKIYYALKTKWIVVSRWLSVRGARLIRFLAIPYLLATRMDWSECRRNVLLVFFDHLYIFFRLGYFPDNYMSCRLWEKKRKEWNYYWGSSYDPYVTSLLRRRVLRRDGEVLFEDKEICYHLCQSYGLPLPLQYGTLDPGDPLPQRIRELFANQGAHTLILKPVNGAGGKGICLIQPADGDFIVRLSREPQTLLPLSNLSIETRYVIQERVVQHPAFDVISPWSLNTVRIATLMTPDDTVIEIGAFLRFGRGQSFVDNLCSGGYSLAIDLQTGRGAGEARDHLGRIYPLPMVTRGAVEDFTMPHWGDLVQLARRVQEHFAPFNRMIGMDIATTPSGPVLIEINSQHDNATMESTCGPILKNDAVRRAFLEYGIISHRLLSAA